MMELFRSWLFGILSTALLLAVLYALVPSGKYRTAIRFSGGLVLLLAVLGPLGQLPGDWDLSYECYAREIQDRIDSYQEENLKRTQIIIEERIAAYISDKGSDLGILCHPQVTTRLRDGVPYPDTVTLDVPMHGELAEYIARELDIPTDRQYWQER